MWKWKKGRQTKGEGKRVSLLCRTRGGTEGAVAVISSKYSCKCLFIVIIISHMCENIAKYINAGLIGKSKMYIFHFEIK